MTPRYNWNIAKFGIKHQSINQLINIFIWTCEWWELIFFTVIHYF